MHSNESEGSHEYPTTHWSQIYLANQPDQESGMRALDNLLGQYRSPLLRHLQNKFRASQEDAEDWLHSFIERRIMAKRLLERADQRRGKFRTFLLNALDNFVIDDIRARKHPLPEPPQDMDDPPPASFEAEWAMAIFEQAKERTRSFYEKKGRGSTWAVFRDAILLPARKSDRPSDAELAQRYGFDSARQASNAIITAQREFGKQLRAVIKQYLEDASEVDDELRELIRIISFLK